MNRALDNDDGVYRRARKASPRSGTTSMERSASATMASRCAKQLDRNPKNAVAGTPQGIGHQDPWRDT